MHTPSGRDGLSPGCGAFGAPSQVMGRGLVLSFLMGLLALRWLTRWLDRGKWHYFGCYCLFAAAVVLALHRLGY